MYRLISLVLGGLMIACGVVWFFTSLLDPTVKGVVGPAAAAAITPLSKMALGEWVSMVFAGVALAGVALVLLAVLGAMSSSRDRGGSASSAA